MGNHNIEIIKSRRQPVRWAGSPSAFCYGDEENTRTCAVYLTTANQSEIRESVSRLCGHSSRRKVSVAGTVVCLTNTGRDSKIHMD